MRLPRRDERGFTLIELLVVMIIIGILAAIAIPLFINQRRKAEDSAARSDVSTLGKEITASWIDSNAMAVVDVNSGFYTVNGIGVGKVSRNVELGDAAGTSPFDWCVYVTNPEGYKSATGFEYSAAGGLQVGTCA